jgi:chemotaxis protein MotB
MVGRSSKTRRGLDIWPGFVDALSTLLMVVTFLLMIFVVAQFYLNQAISGRDDAVRRLQDQVAQLGDLLALERRSSNEMRLNIARLSDELSSSVARRDELNNLVESLTIRAEKAEGSSKQLGLDLEEAKKLVQADKETIEAKLGEIAKISQDLAALQALKAEMEQEIAAAAGKLDKSQNDLIEERKVSDSARAQVALLNRQMDALRKQLSDLQNLLDVSEKTAKDQNVQINNLGQRLNAALAGKVEELSRYRSEFFGRLRELLGDQPDIRIVGDRFVFQSEVLFETGSAQLGDNGQEQMSRLARSLAEIAGRIPKEIPWILEVDGHTDRVPIRTAAFPSNWELSTARATSVVKYLIGAGIPADHLAAAGFGEYQPLDEKDDEIARRRNRRIELKLTQR